MWQAGLVAPVPEPIAEPVGAVRRAELGDKKRQVSAWRGVDDSAKLGVNRDRQLKSGLILGLFAVRRP